MDTATKLQLPGYIEIIALAKDTEEDQLMRPARRPIAIAIAAALTALLAVSIGATPAIAANADACGVVTQHTLAKAFGLSTAIEHKTVLRKPGNPAGVINERCAAFAYKGPKPTTSAKRRSALLAGVGAELKIETWVADSGPSAEVWLANVPNKLAALKKQARAKFIEGDLHGSTYQSPKFGAEDSIGYQGLAGKISKIRALWWERSSGTLILVDAAQAKSKPLRASLRTLMAGIVPGVL